MSLEEVIEAYFDCRRNKRNTANQLRFEMDYERECVDLWQKINEHRYEPRRSIAFVVEKPVKREIFAADFRDRVVHHLIVRRIMPRSRWKGLPGNKSLFGTDGTCGIPIGNLTSQLLALLYLDNLDTLVTGEWCVPHYGRYVDDMVMIHPSKRHLMEVRRRICQWLEAHGLTIHVIRSLPATWYRWMYIVRKGHRCRMVLSVSVHSTP